MGMKGKQIVKVNVEELINLMNKALADEWLAYYQYWVGAKIVKGPFMGAVKAELQEHAQEELKHADMLTERILVLGGSPIIHPQKWFEMSNCKYAEPKDPSTKAILKQNIDGERCAISVYQKLIELTEGKDILSYNMFVSILEEEVEHEDDLENYLEVITNV